MKFSKFITEKVDTIDTRDTEDIYVLTPDMLGKEFSLQNNKQKYITTSKSVYLKYGTKPTLTDYEYRIDNVQGGKYVVYTHKNKKIGTSIDRIDIYNPPQWVFDEWGKNVNLKAKWKSVIHMKIYFIISEYQDIFNNI